MPEPNNYPVWPGWETVRIIGRGSFGTVYEIQRDVFGETEKAALKVISIPQSESDIRDMYGDGYDEESITSTFKDHLKSIVAEYALMRRLNGSANVVNCDDMRYIQHADGIGWDIFIKMELLTPLSDTLPPEIPQETVVRVGKDLCRALLLCKKHGIIHRDIKPQNIFLSPNGDYKLGDFGIAKTVEKTTGGTKIGTYKYMAPEVYNNRPYGAGADIYSLGLVLYWMLNRRRMPFMPLPPEKPRAGMEEAARLRRFTGEALPPPADGSEELRRIVLKACAYDPRDRYQSAEDMLHDLENLGRVITPAPAPSVRPEQEPDSIPGQVPEPIPGQEPRPDPEEDPDATISSVYESEKPAGDIEETAAVSRGSEQDVDETIPIYREPKNNNPVVTVHSPQNKSADLPQPKKKKGWLWIAALAAVAGIVLFLICGQGQTGAEMSSGAGQTIPDGNYMIVQTYDQNSFLDIPGVAIPANFEDNVWLCSTDGEPFQPWDVWTVRYVDEGGFYEICQMDTDMALDVYYASMEKGGNIQVSYSNGTPAQRWSISSFRDGWRLQAKCSGFALEIVDLNAQQGPSSYTNKTQCWTFIPYGQEDGNSAQTTASSDLSGECGDNCTWMLSNGVLTIEGTGQIDDYSYKSLVSPDLPPWHGNRRLISHIVIMEGVTGIGDLAFKDCYNLTSVSIPKSVTRVGKQAFSGCGSLSAVYYDGSKAKWMHQIAFGEENNNLLNSEIQFNG